MARGLLGVALAAAASGATSAAPLGGAALVDASVLLQVHADLGDDGDGARAEGGGPCRCLKWKEAYSSYGVRCGSGAEFGGLPARRSKRDGSTRAEVCGRFYEQFDESYCLFKDSHDERTETWCYVSSECGDLNGGVRLENSAASWRVCNRSQDRTLYDQSPESLFQIAQSARIDPAYLMKMAYPVWPQKLNRLRWEGVQIALGRRKPRGMTQEETLKLLKQIQETGSPWLVNSADGSLPYGVVWGDKVVEAKYSAWFWTKSDSFGDVSAVPQLYSDELDEYALAAAGAAQAAWTAHNQFGLWGAETDTTEQHRNTDFVCVLGCSSSTAK